jgi:hypothetical protein
MKSIKVKNRHVSIPDSWEDLKFGDKIFTFKILIRVLHGDLRYSPHAGLLKLLVQYTGYKPSRDFIPRLHKRLSCLTHAAWIYACNIPFLCRYGWNEYREYARLLHRIAYPPRNPEDETHEREIIDLGLLRLAGQMDFVYRIDSESHRIIPLYRFRANPFPFVVVEGRRYAGKRFLLGVTAVTDITARCFVDALDMLIAMQQTAARHEKDECVDRICAILYPAVQDHNENLLCGHVKRMRKLSPVFKFGIVYWFTGIVNQFREHETYRILFDRNENTDDGTEDKISIGMNEIALFLKKEGYGDSAEMNLVDYFDAQVKSLKDHISRAIAEGVKPEQISQKTGIPLSTIARLG